MPIARIACAVILRVETYDEADGADARLLADEKATQAARDQAATGVSAPLNPGAGPIGQERPGGSSRPSFALPPILPLTWSVTYNSFRVADELEITIPLEALPLPSTAIRSLTVSAVVRHVDADTWGDALATNDLARALFAGTDGEGDFEGICANVDDDAEGLPIRTLKFVDYVGVLASKQVPVGKELDREIPVSEAIRAFLEGSPAEGLAVVWVDPDNVEPDLGKGTPKAKKKGKSKSAAATHSGQKYLDVITKECGLLGVVPRVSGARLELGFAGTIYEGRDRGGEAKATLLLGTVIEKFTASHALIGNKIHTVGVTSYDPDKGVHLMARWPPDPKTAKPVVVKPGEPPRLPPIAANVGLPGASQLDESILMVPVAPCSDPQILREMARAIFVERTRQKLKYKLSTHAPWADPDDPDADEGPLLRLRAGDNVRFGVVADFGAPIRPELRALVAGADAGATAALLRAQGVKPDIAAKVADAIAKAPPASLFRVDEMKVSGGKEAAVIDLTIVNFTTIVADLQDKAEGKTSGDYLASVGKLVEAAKGQTLQETNAQFAALFRDLQDSGLGGAEKQGVMEAAQRAHAEATKGKR